MFLLAGDLDTHIYSEIRDEIVRDDADVITKAIKEAIVEAKGYMSRFDLLKLFGNDAADPVVDPTVDDENLKSKVKDIVIWRLIRLANPNINIELARTNYEDTIKWFQSLQAGKVDPEGWPYKVDDALTKFNENNTIQSSYNKKRRQHY